MVRCLSQQVEGAEIHFVTKKKHAQIVSSNPHITKTHVLGEKMGDLLETLEEEQFDYIVDLHQNIRSNRIKNRLKIPAFTFEKLNFQKWLLVNWRINKLPNKHIVDRYMDTTSVFDITNDNKGLDFFIPENQNYDIQKLPTAFSNGFVAFVIAGTYSTKRLPLNKAVEICNSLKKPIILLGGNHEFSDGEQIIEQSEGDIINYAGKLTLNESASIIKHANVVLSNDTGLMHIAAAFNKKILSFWGNTVPEFGMSPYEPHPASKMIEVANLKCRPCSKLGYEKCPKKHFNCMNQIDTKNVVDWINTNY